MDAAGASKMYQYWSNSPADFILQWLILREDVAVLGEGVESEDVGEGAVDVGVARTKRKNGM